MKRILTALMLLALCVGTLIGAKPAIATDVNELDFVESLKLSLRDSRSLIRGDSIKEVILLSEVDEMGATKLLRATVVLNPDGSRFGTLEGDGQTYRTVCPRAKKCYLDAGNDWIQVPERLEKSSVLAKLITSDPLSGISPQSFEIDGRTYRVNAPDGFLLVVFSNDRVDISARQYSDGSLLEARSTVNYIKPRTVLCEGSKRLSCRVLLVRRPS